jgi:5-methylcytosine-specific restriction protein A
VRGRCDEHQPIPWEGRDDKAGRYGITSGEWRSLKAKVARRDNGCCYLCGAETPDPGDLDAEPHQLDHVIPIFEGGARRDLDNLGLACVPCHEAKSKAEARRANRQRRERARARRR